MRKVAITTEDNPFDPFTQFDDWLNYDSEKGYNTCQYLARIGQWTDFMTEEEEMEEKERAIDEILHFNLTGNYKKVVRNE